MSHLYLMSQHLIIYCPNPTDLLILCLLKNQQTKDTSR